LAGPGVIAKRNDGRLKTEDLAKETKEPLDQTTQDRDGDPWRRPVPRNEDFMVVRNCYLNNKNSPMFIKMASILRIHF
jgi:hypothetical protein